MNGRRLSTVIFCFVVVISLFLIINHPGKANISIPSNTNIAPDWQIECVDCPRSLLNMSDHALQVDADGHSHVAYGGDHLYYAWQDGVQWQTEIVDEARGTGNYASLALDANGYPHISYYDSVNTALKYAFQDENGWHIQIIDSEGNVGARSSLGLDTLNMPHISYSDDTNLALKYAYFNGSNWSLETVDSTGASPSNNSLAMDHNNLPHISYYDAAQDKPKYAYWTGSAWEIQTIDLAYGGQFTSIAVDSNNLPHISILIKFYSIYHLRYAHWNGSAWDIQEVDSDNYAGIYSSITVDENDRPVIAYGTLQGTLKSASWNGSSWDLQIVAESVYLSPNGAVALSLDLSEFPRIIYQVERWTGDPIHTLNQAAWDGGQWDFETIDTASEAGGPTSLVLDENGNTKVAYRAGVVVNGSPADLSYASFDGNVWQSQTVVGDQSVGWDLSLDIGENGDPTIAYADYIAYAINYAHWTGSTWDIQSMGNGQYVSLALDDAGNPHLAFGQYHVFWDGNAWIYEVVPNMGAEGVSLALDSSGFAHISYYQNNEIRYAFWDGSQWTTQTVDTNIGYSAPPSLALDQNDRPHISYYYGYPNGVLRYASNTSGDWQIQTVDAAGDVGHDSSIAVDSLGYPHISYMDVTNADLKYAAWDGNSWFIQTIADVGFAYGSQGTSIQVDANNNPYISYYDWTTRDVMLAKLIKAPVVPQEIALYGPAEGDVQSSLTFTATTSPISTTLPIRYIWEATDQAPITITNGLESSADYSWDAPGTKTITVTVSNIYGLLSTTHQITLSDIPVSGISAVNDSPKYVGETVVFTATVTLGTNVTYIWDFGDGTGGSGATVSHVYLEAGNYTATVTATNSTNSESIGVPVTILPIDTAKQMFLPVITK